VKRAIYFVVAIALMPVAWMMRCPQCRQRSLRAEVAPHRNGRPGVFWHCRSCGAKTSAL
jgi:transposase-like protein